MADNDFVIENGVLIKYNGNGGDVVIPEGVTAIGDQAFFECSSLTAVVIPENLTDIDDTAFECCESLTVSGVPGSYAEKYAKEHGLRFVYST